MDLNFTICCFERNERREREKEGQTEREREKYLSSTLQMATSDLGHAKANSQELYF